MQNLLKLAGVVSITDLVEVDEDFIDEVEKQVRQGDFSNQADFSLREIISRN